MKFYDKGFITKYDNYINVEILSAGNSILKLDIYNDKICRSTFECKSAHNFNKEYMSDRYEDSFLFDLFNDSKKEIIFRDKKNRVLIKIIKD